jgi:3-oxoadipate enol-lactonase
MPQFVRDAVTIHYEVAGNPEGPWLFFSHSLGANLSMWEPQIEAFSRSFRVLRFDTRGHGQSSVPPGPYSVAQLGEDVLALADHVSAKHFHFCGLSMGGLIGQWLGLNAPERLGKLVLCDTAARIGNPESWGDRIRTVESSGIGAIVEGGLQRWFTPRFFRDHADTVNQFRSMIVSTNPKGYIANCAALAQADFTSSVHAISVPVLAVCATHDPVTTVEDARFLVDAINGAQLLELDAAHLSNVEQADSFNKAVFDFLD